MMANFPESITTITEKNLFSLNSRIATLEKRMKELDTETLPLSFCCIRSHSWETLSELINNFLRVHNICNNTLHYIEEKVVHHVFTTEYVTTFWYNECPDLVPPFQRDFQNEKVSKKEDK